MWLLHLLFYFRQLFFIIWLFGQLCLFNCSPKVDCRSIIMLGATTWYLISLLTNYNACNLVYCCIEFVLSVFDTNIWSSLKVPPCGGNDCCSYLNSSRRDHRRNGQKPGRRGPRRMEAPLAGVAGTKLDKLSSFRPMAARGEIGSTNHMQALPQ